MKIDDNIAKLILHFEYIVGDSCYNPNSYNGWTDEEGCSFRYPVHFSPDNTEENDSKFRTDISENWYNWYGSKPESIKSLHYAFGSNHLYIGQALRDILEEIEERYGLDINQLEEEYQKKLKKEE